MTTFESTFQSLNLPEADVRYAEEYFNTDGLFERIDKTTPWERFKVKIQGKEIDQPRLTCFMGDVDKPYYYSGYNRIPVHWTPIIKLIRDSIQEDLPNSHPKITSVLINKYRDGHDYIGLHSDDETDLNKNAYIISVSFGATRNFWFVNKKTNDKTTLALTDGSVVLMGKGTQANYKHTVPKSLKITEPRINLTFRCVK